LSERIPWDQLNEKAANAVADVIVLLAAGFTGEITLVCGEGGVKAVRVGGGKEAVSMLKEASRERMKLTDGHKAK
jgi:hypothetical protein